MNIWTCKIGETDDVPPEADWPMRQAVARAYREVTGHEAKFCFSGWGGYLTKGEREVADCTCTTYPHKPFCASFPAPPALPPHQEGQ